MDVDTPMAANVGRAERVEPTVRRKAAGGANLDIGVTDRDRPGARTGREPGDGRTAGAGRRGGGSGNGKPPGKPRKKRGFFRRTLRVLIIGIALLIVTGAGVIAYFAAGLPDVTSWEVPDRPPNIRIVAVDGSVIANRGDTGGENVTIEELPEYLPQAVVAIEDRRFYSHLGVDPIGLARVLFDAASGDRLTGASTITQQLARTLFLSLDRTFERKAQEAILSVWLEVQYSKNEILEMYLNRVYFGAGAYGVDAAARVYFGKPASAVTLAEAAILAGVLPAPSRYAPTANPQAARNRQLLVLNAMVEAGYITEAEAATAAEGEITTVDNTASGSLNYAADWVADLVPSFVGAIQGDIVVETTIDPRLQDMAATALAGGLDETGESLGVEQGALVAMDPDGAVRALVGGRDYTESQYNRAVTAQRQPGSSFKPFVYLTALEYGMTPETVRFDQAVNIDGWTPENYNQEYLGPVSLQRALALSLNTISVQLTNEVGPEAVVATARRLGIGSQIEPLPSIALGTSEVSVLEMTGAYATFANGGTGVIPYVISRISTVDGDVLYERSPSAGPGQVIHPQYVAMMNSMMQETLSTGTGRRAVIEGRPAGGKTGTSQEWRDAWFIGYTADLVAGIWIGNDDNSPTARASGGNLPASIWNAFMTQAMEGVPVSELPGEYFFSDPALVGGAQNIDDIINQRGVYNEYDNTYDPLPAIPQDQFNPEYDPRLDPNYQQNLPPAPVGNQPASGAPAPPAGQLPASGPPAIVNPPQNDNGLFGGGGFLRRLFGG